MRRSAHFVFLLLALSAFLLVPPAVALAGVSVHATADDGILDVQIAADEAAEVHVVVTHEDPLAGTVIDRVVRVNASAGANAVLRLDDLRVDANFTVRVLDASIELPKVPGLDLINVSALLGIVPLVEAPAPPLAVAPAAVAHEPFVYLAGTTASPFEKPRALVTSEGVLVVAWMRRANTAEGNDTYQLTASVSRDGGHTYRRADLTPTMQVHGVSWAMVEAPGRAVDFLYTAYGSQARGEAIRLDLDTMTPNRLGTGAGSLGAAGPQRLASHGDAALVASVDANVTLTVLAADAPARVLGRVVMPRDAGGVSHVTPVSNGERAAAVWAARDANGALSVWWTRADDAGRLSAPARAAALPGQDVRSLVAAMDERGVLHIAASALRGDPERPSASDGRYVRIPLVGPPTSAEIGTLLDRADSGAFEPAIATRAGRVWLAWTQSDRAYAAESTNGGVTFDAPYHIAPRTRTGAALAGPEALAVFPDGRPATLHEGWTEFNTVTKVTTRPFYVAPLFEASPRPDLAHDPTPSPLVVRTSAPPATPTFAPGHLLEAPPFTPDRTPQEIRLEAQPVLTEGERQGTQNVPAPPASLAVGAGAAVALAVFRRRH